MTTTKADSFAVVVVKRHTPQIIRATEVLLVYPSKFIFSSLVFCFSAAMDRVQETYLVRSCQGMVRNAVEFFKEQFPTGLSGQFGAMFVKRGPGVCLAFGSSIGVRPFQIRMKVSFEVAKTPAISPVSDTPSYLRNELGIDLDSEGYEDLRNCLNDRIIEVEPIEGVESPIQAPSRVEEYCHDFAVEASPFVTRRRRSHSREMSCVPCAEDSSSGALHERIAKTLQQRRRRMTMTLNRDSLDGTVCARSHSCSDDEDDEDDADCHSRGERGGIHIGGLREADLSTVCEAGEPTEGFENTPSRTQSRHVPDTPTSSCSLPSTPLSCPIGSSGAKTSPAVPTLAPLSEPRQYTLPTRNPQSCTDCNENIPPSSEYPCTPTHTTNIVPRFAESPTPSSVLSTPRKLPRLPITPDELVRGKQQIIKSGKSPQGRAGTWSPAQKSMSSSQSGIPKTPAGRSPLTPRNCNRDPLANKIALSPLTPTPSRKEISKLSDMPIASGPLPSYLSPMRTPQRGEASTHSVCPVTPELLRNALRERNASASSLPDLVQDTNTSRSLPLSTPERKLEAVSSAEYLHQTSWKGVKRRESIMPQRSEEEWE
eukprot:Rmarinus@m.18356